jgi:hypothetical protein
MPFLLGIESYITVTFAAAGPFAPCSMSKETWSPSLRDLKPAALIDE